MPELGEVGNWLQLKQCQHMVRVTCLEVMGATPSQIESYRQEVLELQRMIGSLTKPDAPSSPSTASMESAAERALLIDGTGKFAPPGTTTLQAEFTVHPERAWFEGRALPRFSVAVKTDAGEPWPTDSQIVLRASLRNGRGHAEELQASGSGALVAGERAATVMGGEAVWEQLRICEASSKHYRSFTLCINATALPPGTHFQELRSEPLTVQVARMWHKRKKTEAELSPDDAIHQIPGVGPAYVSRLKLQGVHTIRHFAGLAGTEEGRKVLAKLCKGDDPRNGLTAGKLQSMIEHAQGVMRGSAQKGSKDRRGAAFAAARAAPAAPVSAATSTDPMDALDALSVDELLLLAGERGEHAAADEAMGAVHALAEVLDDDMDETVRMRKLAVAKPSELSCDASGAAAAKASAIQIMPPSPGKAAGFGAFDKLGAAAAAATSPLLDAFLGKPLDAAAAASARSRDGCTPLHLAALGGQLDTVKALCRGSAMLNAQAGGLGGATPLLLAACCGPRGTAVGAELLRAGADASVAVTPTGLHAAHVAAFFGAHELLAALLDAQPRAAEAMCAARLTPLHYAALGGNAGCVGLLLPRRAGGGDEGAEAMPVLHCAALHGHTGGMEQILEAQPAQVSARGVGGWTALHCCASTDDLDGLRLLLKAGAAVDATDDDGMTALHVACVGGHADCVKELVGASASTSCRCGESSWTPLQCASAVANVECIQALLGTA